MTDASEVPAKCFKHLTDEDLGILLGTYRMIKSEDNPAVFAGVDIPRGHELIEEIQKRLKKSGPNLSWDQTVDRRKAPELDVVVPPLPWHKSLSRCYNSEAANQLIMFFDTLMTHAHQQNQWPSWWPERAIAMRIFRQSLLAQIEAMKSLDATFENHVVVFPEQDNKLLKDLNDTRRKIHPPTTDPFYEVFFFVARQGDLGVLLESA